jgi:hypothetical protein
MATFVLASGLVADGQELVRRDVDGLAKCLGQPVHTVKFGEHPQIRDDANDPVTLHGQVPQA